MRRETGWKGLVAAAVAMALTGCGSDPVKGCTDPTATNYDPAATVDDGSCLAFQGPRNPDFEGAETWTNDSSNGYAGNGTGQIVTGSSFMPTHGTHYLSLFTSTTNNWYYGTCTVYQDDVHFDLATTLTFDYEFWGSAGDGMSVTVELLFTSNGTDVLWSQTFTGYYSGMFPASFDDHIVNETVTLPVLPDAGRLTLKLSTVGGQNATGYFSIDNVRVD